MENIIETTFKHLCPGDIFCWFKEWNLCISVNFEKLRVYNGLLEEYSNVTYIRLSKQKIHNFTFAITENIKILRS